MGLEAFRWTGVVMTGLGDLPGGAFRSEATGVSNDGTVVVGYSNSASGNEAFRWTGGVMTGLGVLPGGGTSSLASDVSANGTVVVGDANFQPFRWTSGSGMVGLGDLPGGSFFGEARAVSADGAVVVGKGDSASGFEATIWTQANGLQRLLDVLVANGVTGLTGWTLIEANAVSDDGTLIVGLGQRAGVREAFLANIAPVPAPATVWLLGSALAGLGARRLIWRRSTI
jgi:probable HAF family extracellular repeat protein